jgi:hypothetical protein
VPFNADTPFSIIHDHIYSPLPMPRSINPNVPELVQRVLLKALAKDRADRYLNVDALVQAFKDAWVDSGVPMQGTAITMRPASLKAAPASVAAATNAAKRTQSAKPAPQTSPWLFIAGGALLLLCLGIGALVLVRAGGLSSLLRPAPAASVVPTLTSANTTSNSSSVETPQVPTSEVSVPAIATAQAAVNQNPTDPQAGLTLSLAYWDAGQVRPALVTLAKAADSAGPDNTQFFEQAGDQFKQRQAWIAAAAMYVRAVKSLGASVKPGDDVINNYHEALYKAAILPEFTTYLSFDDLGRVEQPMMMVARARYLYNNGDTAQGHQVLNQVILLKPHMAEASLLGAEMDATEGKTSDAKQTLLILLSDLNTPDWVREAAQTLSNKIP